MQFKQFQLTPYLYRVSYKYTIPPMINGLLNEDNTNNKSTY